MSAYVTSENSRAVRRTPIAIAWVVWTGLSLALWALIALALALV